MAGDAAKRTETILTAAKMKIIIVPEQVRAGWNRVAAEVNAAGVIP